MPPSRIGIARKKPACSSRACKRPSFGKAKWSTQSMSRVPVSLESRSANRATSGQPFTNEASASRAMSGGLGLRLPLKSFEILVSMCCHAIICRGIPLYIIVNIAKAAMHKLLLLGGAKLAK